MPAPMERLPVELIELVIRHFTLPEYQSLRLVSRRLYALTLSTFSGRYFAKRFTTLSKPSLERLAQASASHLSQHVSLLDIQLLNRQEYQSLREISRIGIYPPPKRFQQVAKVRPRDVSREYALYDYMLSSDEPKDVIKILAQVLEQLPSVRGVRLRVNGESILSRTVTHFHAGEEEKEEEYSMFVQACFKAVIAAIVCSGVRLREFSVVKGGKIRSYSKSANLIYPAFKFSFPLLLSLREAFGSLKTLRLTVRTDFHGNSRVPGWQNGISQFIASASALEELALCFLTVDKEAGFKASVMQSLASTLDLPRLKFLQLYGSVVDEQVLSSFVKAHSNLRQMLFTDVRLLNGSWKTVLRVFRELPSLETLRLSFLQQSEDPQNIWWFREKCRKSALILDTTDKKEERTMAAMLTEALEYLDLIASVPEVHVLPYNVLLAYTHNHHPVTH
jgi:hypothetical protein